MRAITRYEARDGSMHDTEHECRKHEAALLGRAHECPKCHGTSKMRGEPITERQIDEYDQSGSMYPVYRTVTVGYKPVPCDVCQGHGWTAQEKKAITKTEIVGYE